MIRRFNSVKACQKKMDKSKLLIRRILYSVFCVCQYSVNKNIKPDLCDYSDAYIVVKGRITVEGNTLNN